MTWNNLDWKFRRDTLESIDNTTIRRFLDQMNNKSSIWYEIIKKFDSKIEEHFDNLEKDSRSNNSKNKSRDQANDYY